MRTFCYRGFLGRILLSKDGVLDLSLASLGYSYYNTYDGKSLNALKNYGKAIFKIMYPDDVITIRI